MKVSKRITLFFIIVILLSIFIISGISNFMINNRFEKFLVEEQELKLKEISKEINQLYEENGYKLYQRDIDSYASLEDLSIDIVDLDNNVLYSSNINGMGNMHGRMMKMHGISQGERVEKSFPLLEKDKEVGTLVIGYIDNSYLTEGAIVFKNTLTRSLLLSAILAIFIGVGTSLILSKSLTVPLLSIRNTAVEMQKGNLSKKSKVKTNMVEIKELSDSINYLGETLAKQENIRKKYASDISHELRTPLTTLQSHLEAIMDGIWEPSNEHLGILMDEVNRLSSLVDNLKDSFNSEEHEMILNKTNFDLSKELKNIVTTFIPLYAKEGFVIETDIEENIHVYMDKNKLKQVISNLLSNSINYLNNEGQVFISLTKGKENILIKFKDNGIGIAEKDLPYIFDRFYRGDESRNKNTGGTGLGLSIVKSIVEAHNGTIEVKSSYGEETEFIISLPVRS